MVTLCSVNSGTEPLKSWMKYFPGDLLGIVKESEVGVCIQLPELKGRLLISMPTMDSINFPEITIGVGRSAGAVAGVIEIIVDCWTGSGMSVAAFTHTALRLRVVSLLLLG
jgi:hypothetical protein